MTYPKSVNIIEVGLRDGLQMESTFVDTAVKVELLDALIAAGIRHFEATSFVSPRAVPQLRDAADVLSQAQHPAGVTLAALAPNRKGAERALESSVDEIVVFLSASETHNQKNLNRPIEQSLRDIEEIAETVTGSSIACKGAVAVAFGCPFEGDIPFSTLEHIVTRFHQAGFRALTLGDTTGMATPHIVKDTVRRLQDAFPDIALTLHFHNTRGIGLVNVMAGLECGIDSYESSVGGLGGCPFAPNATGNICTEDLVYLLHETGIDTGIDLEKLIRIAQRLEDILGRTLPGQLMKAGPRSRLHSAKEVAAAVG